MTKSERHYRDGMIRGLRNLLDLMESDPPGCIVAHAFTVLEHYATGFCGENLFAERARRAIEISRQHSGFCGRCDTELPPILSQTGPLCEQCDARLEDECDQMEREAGLTEEDPA